AKTRLEELLQKNSTRDEAVMEFVKETLLHSKAIRFDGNGYSQEWVDEALKRGLSRLQNTSDAVKVYRDQKQIEFLIEEKVYKASEVESRFNVQVERYVKTLMIELAMLSDMTKTFVLPSVEKQLINIYEILDEASDGLKKVYKTRVHEVENVLRNLVE